MDLANANRDQAGAVFEPLPIAALFALAMTGFICIASETLPAGLLPLIAADMHISNAVAGQTVRPMLSAHFWRPFL